MAQINTAEFIKRASAFHGKTYDYSRARCTRFDSVVTVICKKHGAFQIAANRHYTGAKCQKCALEIRSGKRSLNVSEFVAKAKEIHGDRYDYSKVVYKNALSHVDIVCTQHGTFSQTPASHTSGRGCPKCGRQVMGDKQRTAPKKFVQGAKRVHDDYYSYRKTNYTEATNKVVITCPKHGDFEQKAYSHLAGRGCPQCANKGPSSQESRIARLLSRLDIEFTQSDRTKIRNPETGHPLELDIYVPSCRLAIEVNGVYWHSDRTKNAAYHQKKLELCESRKRPIRLMQFWDKDVVNNWPVVRSMIRNAVGRAKHRVYARDCEVRIITPSESRIFMERNHLKGNAGASTHYGLFFDGDLVSAMTFSRPKFDRSFEWEIIRFASRRNWSVIGGASRLFTHFVRDQKAKNCMSYADLMTGTGSVYKQLGFKETSKTAPGYFWLMPNNTILPRYRTQKHRLEKLFDSLGKLRRYKPNLSEDVNMKRVGAYKCHNAGNAKLAWHVDMQK